MVENFIVERILWQFFFDTRRRKFVSSWKPKMNALHRKNKFSMFQRVVGNLSLHTYSKTILIFVQKHFARHSEGIKATIQSVESTRFYNLSACINLSLNLQRRKMLNFCLLFKRLRFLFWHQPILLLFHVDGDIFDGT